MFDSKMFDKIASQMNGGERQGGDTNEGGERLPRKKRAPKEAVPGLPSRLVVLCACVGAASGFLGALLFWCLQHFLFPI